MVSNGKEASIISLTAMYDLVIVECSTSRTGREPDNARKQSAV